MWASPTGFPCATSTCRLGRDLAGGGLRGRGTLFWLREGGWSLEAGGEDSPTPREQCQIPPFLGHEAQVE